MKRSNDDHSLTAGVSSFGEGVFSVFGSLSCISKSFYRFSLAIPVIRRSALAQVGAHETFNDFLFWVLAPRLVARLALTERRLF